MIITHCHDFTNIKTMSYTKNMCTKLYRTIYFKMFPSQIFFFGSAYESSTYTTINNPHWRGYSNCRKSYIRPFNASMAYLYITFTCADYNIRLWLTRIIISELNALSLFLCKSTQLMMRFVIVSHHKHFWQ